MDDRYISTDLFCQTFFLIDSARLLARYFVRRSGSRFRGLRASEAGAKEAFFAESSSGFLLSYPLSLF